MMIVLEHFKIIHGEYTCGCLVSAILLQLYLRMHISDVLLFTALRQSGFKWCGHLVVDCMQCWLNKQESAKGLPPFLLPTRKHSVTGCGENLLNNDISDSEMGHNSTQNPAE